MSDAARSAKQYANRASGDTDDWIERLARFGYAAKGLVYVVVGWIAIQAAFSSGSGSASGSRGALRSIVDEPFGQVLLGIVAVGLLGYVIWRFVQAATDPEGKGDDKEGIAKRIGYAISGVLYGGLMVQAARLALGGGGSGGSSGSGSGSGGGDRASDWTAKVLQAPLGQTIVTIVGLGVIAYGLYQLYRAWTIDFGDRLDFSDVDHDKQTWMIRFGRAGLAARGVVFVMMGWFLADAAINYNPSQARGLGGALRTIEGESYGPYLLGLVGLGLLGYGLFQFVRARYRRIQAT